MNFKFMEATLHINISQSFYNDDKRHYDLYRARIKSDTYFKLQNSILMVLNKPVAESFAGACNEHIQWLIH